MCCVFCAEGLRRNFSHFPQRLQKLRTKNFGEDLKKKIERVILEPRQQLGPEIFQPRVGPSLSAGPSNDSMLVAGRSQKLLRLQQNSIDNLMNLLIVLEVLYC